ncbi:MAG: amidohydrolase family protein [Cytophagales bacterium]|nr:amidohydrolase family protein [Armatimonadota bacterium]
MLNPKQDGGADFWPDGAIWGGPDGRIVFVGAWQDLPPPTENAPLPPVRQADGMLMPALLDCHTHLPQFPIRGRFTEGIDGDPPEGRLLAGLNRNVFPAEHLAADPDYAAAVIREFAADTLQQGVLGGSTFMTVHVSAARRALERLHPAWFVGLVLMNQNCPPYLRTNEDRLEEEIAALAADYGDRLILSDRFAVAVDTPLRVRAAALAGRFGLRMQTHLNEQRREKAFVEQELYPDCESYADVYRRDGLLDHAPILAHCLQMTPQEWEIVAAAPRAALAHCPTSNTLLGSGTLSLADVRDRQIPYALCTDVGASPTTSLLAEMAQFLSVHAAAGDEARRIATPAEALFRVTVAPARILGLESQFGALAVGKPCTFLEVDIADRAYADAESAIRDGLLGLSQADLDRAAASPALRSLSREGLRWGPEMRLVTQEVHQTAHRLENKVVRVTQAGKMVWKRG